MNGLTVSLERKIAFGLGSALLILLLVTAAAGWNIARFSGTQVWVNHTREVLGHLEQTLSLVLNMQTSTRGFVLTGSEDMLRPHVQSGLELERTLAALRRLTGGNPRQQERLTRLEPLIARARQIMSERIAARRARGLAAASETQAYLDGQYTVESARAVVLEMVAEERRLLDDRLARTLRFGRLSIVTIITSSGLAIVLVLFGAAQVRRDLHRRRDAELALQESYARIEDLYNHAPCGYQSLDPQGIIVEINDTALAWLGYTREEVVGRMNFTEILTPQSAAAFVVRYATFKQTGTTTNAEYEWRRKDGTLLPVLLNATAIYDRQGNYVASRATLFDVTMRKRAEAERDRFFTLARDLLCVASFDGTFTRVNPAWETVLGLKADELLAHPIIDFVHPDDREQTIEETRRLMRGEETVDFENRYRRRDGSFRWLRWSARSVASEKLIYASARDVTERKNDDERIQSLNADLALRAAQLEAANAELESFSYSVSHDLRAPLRHIDGFASLLARRTAASTDPDARRYVTTISRAAKQMGTLIDDLLAFSRIGRTPLRLERLNHNRLVADVISDGHYGDGGNSITWEIGPLPDVRADAAMLRQVWRNLIDNAVKYSGKAAEPRITIGGNRNPATVDEYVFFTRDNGVGFDMSYVDKLFGVFQRLHGPSEFEGTGIGLANVRRIVSRHGGRTWAEGRVGEGAVFYFTLPVTPSPPRALT